MYSHDSTGSLFALGNAMFAQVILKIARIKPHLLGEGASSMLWMTDTYLRYQCKTIHLKPQIFVCLAFLSLLFIY